MPFLRALGSPVILDGGIGTELQRLGMSIDYPWLTSAALLDENGLSMLVEIHRAYLRAGASVLTANTFRVNRRALERAGSTEPESRMLVSRAVSVARHAADPVQGAVVAGSVAPLEDCYHPELVPPDEQLLREHAWLAEALLNAGVDLLLLETMNCQREAVVALDCAKARGARAWVSFVCSADGDALLSGEALADAARAVEMHGADAVLVNCTGLALIDRSARVLREVCSVPIGIYPNLEDRSSLVAGAHVAGYVSTAWDADCFADRMAELVERHSLSIAGGCCGATPVHIAALSRRLNNTGETYQEL